MVGPRHPVKFKRAEAVDDEAEVLIRFVYRLKWFVLAQTEGAEVPPAEIPGWGQTRALATLDVVEIPFALVSYDHHHVSRPAQEGRAARVSVATAGPATAGPARYLSGASPSHGRRFAAW